MTKEVYQMEPRKAYKNTFQKGISGAERYGVNQFGDTGVPLEGFKGDEVDRGVGEFGVPMPGSDYKREPQTPHCTATTKKGEPCKAAPMSGQHLCVGHNRAAKSDQGGA